ncbi:MAG: DUF3108 domain-containing protein, partial [Bacteroidales bacterium]|nr:DUF3108 domain-containing protein [Bacteroidales bacterium]
MKRLFFTVVFFSFILFHADGQFRAYQPGEKVEYLIHYGAINGGIATLELKKDSSNGRETWHSSMVAMTTGLADALFRVKDIYEVFMDPETELPLVSIRNISEGRYKKYNVVTFDHNSRPDSAILSSDLTGIHITQHGIHDILTCFYWFRNHILPGIDTIKKGQMITIMTWFTDELYPIR